MITFKQLETFVWVADLGSFRRAGERMNTTQPNISARMQALEAELGQRLMDRDAGSVRLTPVGEEVLARARVALKAGEELVLAAGDAGRLEGTLRLGVTEMVAETWLHPLLQRLQAEFGRVQLDLTVDRSAVLGAMLADRGLDLALQSAPFERRTTGQVALGAYPFVWVAGPTVGVADRPLTLAQLTRHPILTHARGTFPYDQLAAHLAGQVRGDLRRITSSNLAACIRMAEAGMGVACLPRAMVAGSLAAGRLRRLNYEWLPDPLDFAARFDADRAPYFLRRAVEIAQDLSRDWIENPDRINPV